MGQTLTHDFPASTFTNKPSAWSFRIISIRELTPAAARGKTAECQGSCRRGPRSTLGFAGARSSRGRFWGKRQCLLFLLLLRCRSVCVNSGSFCGSCSLTSVDSSAAGPRGVTSPTFSVARASCVEPLNRPHPCGSQPGVPSRGVLQSVPQESKCPSSGAGRGSSGTDTDPSGPSAINIWEIRANAGSPGNYVRA